MKRVILSELLLISFKEKKARRIEFDPVRTLLIGGNKTGKSSILKSIYSTFGAIPSKLDAGWISLNIISCIHFKINDEGYTMVKSGKLYGLFKKGTLLLASNKVTDFTAIFSDIFNFKLQGVIKNGTTTTLPIQFLLSPFYIDQDDSWTDSWRSFSNLDYIKGAKNILINYFTGLRPNKYYDLLSVKARLQMEANEVSEHKKITRSILEKIQNQITQTDFNIDIESFKEEIKALLIECEALKAKQERLKDTLLNLHEKKLHKEVQYKLADTALKESLKDYNYATEIELDEEIECPTCGAVYNNSIIERFEFAKDHGKYEELLQVIAEETTIINNDIEKASTDLNKTSAEVLRIEELLKVKKGEIQFKDIIENQGRNEVQKIFVSNIKELNETFNSKAGQILETQQKLKAFDDKDKRERIKLRYVDLMKSHLKSLGSFVSEDKIPELFSKTKQTGSEMPRTLLAYYLAILHLIHDNDDLTNCPIIIDAPFQQDPDREHSEKTLMFLNDFQPKNSQMILGIGDLLDKDIPGKRIFLDKPLNMLSEDEYEDISNEIHQYLDKMRSNNKLF